MAKKEEGKKDHNKYTRREFLKASRRVAWDAAKYGTVGYLAGKGYEYLKEGYQNNIKEPRERIEKGLYNTGKKYDHLKREGKILINGEKAVDEEENRAWEIERQRINKERDEKIIANKENFTRRALLRYPIKYLEQVNKSPVPTLTITGAAFGAANSTIRVIPKYLKERELARLKDKNTEYGERIEMLEDYKSRMERSEERENEEIREEVERVGNLLENVRRASGKLETIVEERPEDHVLSISIGLTGLIASFVLNVSRISGFAIAENVHISSLSLSMLLFFSSLGLIFIGTMRRKIKILQKKPYKFS